MFNRRTLHNAQLSDDEFLVFLNDMVAGKVNWQQHKDIYEYHHLQLTLDEQVERKIFEVNRQAVHRSQRFANIPALDSNADWNDPASVDVLVENYKKLPRGERIAKCKVTEDFITTARVSNRDALREFVNQVYLDTSFVLALREFASVAAIHLYAVPDLPLDIVEDTLVSLAEQTFVPFHIKNPLHVNAVKSFTSLYTQFITALSKEDQQVAEKYLPIFLLAESKYRAPVYKKIQALLSVTKKLDDAVSGTPHMLFSDTGKAAIVEIHDLVGSLPLAECDELSKSDICKSVEDIFTAVHTRVSAMNQNLRRSVWRMCLAEMNAAVNTPTPKRVSCC